MKKVIALIMFGVLAFQGYSQNYASTTSALDTLAATQSLTLTSGQIEKPGGLFFNVTGLKISGTTGGTISYQISGDNGTTWSAVSSDTITNGTTDANYQLDKFIGNKARCVVTADGTTQSGSYMITIAFKRND